MKNLKIIIIAFLFFILGSGTSAIFVSNVLKMKSYRLMKGYSQRSAEKQDEQDQGRLEIAPKETEIDDSGLEGVDAFHAFVNENEVIRNVWPAYKDRLTAILEDGLKKQGLRIVHGLNEPISDFLAMTISVMRDEPSGAIAGSVKLYLNGAFIDHKTRKIVSADRWSEAQAFMVKETEVAEHLEEITRGLMNDFIEDYIKANPEKEGTLSSGATSQ